MSYMRLYERAQKKAQLIDNRVTAVNRFKTSVNDNNLTGQTVPVYKLTV